MAPYIQCPQSLCYLVVRASFGSSLFDSSASKKAKVWKSFLPQDRVYALCDQLNYCGSPTYQGLFALRKTQLSENVFEDAFLVHVLLTLKKFQW